MLQLPLLLLVVLRMRVVRKLCSRELSPCPWTQESGQAATKERDLSSMTEEEQIAYAMQMSMADAEKPEESAKAESMDVDDKEDYSEVMNDPAFLQSVLQNLPGVDPQSEAVRNAMGAMKDEKKDEKKEDKK